VRFKIAVHSGSGAPPEAIELLARRLGSSREETRFSQSGSEIIATWGEDAPVAMASDEREQVGRRAVLDILSDVCEGTSELKYDWYAVSAGRY